MILRLSSYLRLCLLWAMLLPFVVGSVVATGLMPSRSDDGRITLVICTAEGMVETAFDPVTMQPLTDDSPAPATAPETCDWANAHGVYVPALLPDLAWAVTAVAQRNARAADTVGLILAATGLPPATGPPATL